MFLGNETREKSGFVSYVSISLCFDFDPNHDSISQRDSLILRLLEAAVRSCLFLARGTLRVSLTRLSVIIDAYLRNTSIRDVQVV